MAGTHITLDDHMAEHPAWVGATDAEWAAWLKAMFYASRNLTDGFIPTAARPSLGTSKTFDRLVARGRLVIVSDVHYAEDRSVMNSSHIGWQIHGYVERQRSRAEVEQIQAKHSRKGTLGNHKRWHVQKGVRDPLCEFCTEHTALSTDRQPIATAMIQGSPQGSPQGSLTHRQPIAEAEAEAEAESDRASAPEKLDREDTANDRPSDTRTIDRDAIAAARKATRPHQSEIPA